MKLQSALLRQRAGIRASRGKISGVVLFILAAVILLPLAVIVWSLTRPPEVLFDQTLAVSVLRTLAGSALLALTTGFLASVWGVTGAWVVTCYRFRFKKFVEVLFVLPVAVPAYLAGFSWAGFFDFTGPWQRFFRLFFHDPSRIPVPDIMNWFGASLVMSLVLYPYVFLAVRSSFKQQSGSVWESARSLGAGKAEVFYRVALPLARPALFAAASLVMMEALNEYGMVIYYGVETFSTAIFRAWFGRGSVVLALQLTSGLVFIVFLLLFLEKWSRGRKGYVQTGKSSRQVKPVRPENIRDRVLISLSLVPAVLGLGLPLFQSGFWIAMNAANFVPPDFWEAALNSVGLSVTSSAVILAAAIAAAWGLSRRGRRSLAVRFSGLYSTGYAMPGAVIAVALLAVFAALDRSVLVPLSVVAGLKPRLWLSGSFAALGTALVIRYLAVAFQPVHAGFSQSSKRCHEASRGLGKSALYTLFRVDLPIIKHSIIAGGLLIFIDVLKELPLTLILRPFNFETLSTRALEYASDERLHLTALPSLVLTGLGLGAVLFLLHYRKSGGKENA